MKKNPYKHLKVMMIIYEILFLGKTSWYWTDGYYDSTTSMWTWKNSGGTFTATDSRWASNEPGAGPWTTERVVFRMDTQALYSSGTGYKDNVMCEQAN
jgi:hypothetical protein